MVTPERITQEVLTFLQNPEKLAMIKQELRMVREKLGKPGAPDRAAAIIAGLLH
jgi:lipid A disaccharide synthetase